MLALISASGPVRQQCAKTHYASIMLEISMTALFMPKVLTPCACVFVCISPTSSQIKHRNKAHNELCCNTSLNHHEHLTCCHEEDSS